MTSIASRLAKIMLPLAAVAGLAATPALAQKKGGTLTVGVELDIAGFDPLKVGVYDTSPDSRAVLDAAPGVAGLFVAGGFSGTGCKKSPAVGACMAELVTEGAATTVDIRPFRLARFAEGDPIVGDEYRLPAGFGHSL